jgi:hypothetical protein
MLKQLNLPEYSFRMKGKEGSWMIFDQLRRKYVKLTEEEWVRQNFAQYLIQEGGYPPGLMLIEGHYKHNRLDRRVDITVYSRKGEPVLIVECKSPDVDLDDFLVRDQAGEYNKFLKVPYVLFTNGMKHYAFKYHSDLEQYEYLMAIPRYTDLLI